MPDAREYARWSRRAALAALGVELGYLWALLASGLAQRWAAEMSIQPARVGGLWWPTLWWPSDVAVYVAMLALPGTLLMLPLAWYRGFRLEHTMGLSRERLGAWAWRWLKAQAIGGALLLVVAVMLSAILRASPRHWWCWAAAAWVVWSVVLTQWMPVVLLPVFYRQRPLDNSTLAARLRALTERCGLTAAGLYEIDVSRETAKANACLCGLGATRRILLTGTLMHEYPPEEIEAIVAHEIGHHRLRHLPWLLALGALTSGVSFWLVARWLPGALTLFGITERTALAALPVIAAMLSTLEVAWGPLQKWLSRRFEEAADRFALEATRAPAAFIGAMRKLQRQNLAEPDVSRWVEWCWYDHPPIARRVAMAEGWAPS